MQFLLQFNSNRMNTVLFNKYFFYTGVVESNTKGRCKKSRFVLLLFVGFQRMYYNSTIGSPGLVVFHFNASNELYESIYCKFILVFFFYYDSGHWFNVGIVRSVCFIASAVIFGEILDTTTES